MRLLSNALLCVDVSNVGSLTLTGSRITREAANNSQPANRASGGIGTTATGCIISSADINTVSVVGGTANIAFSQSIFRNAL